MKFFSLFGGLFFVISLALAQEISVLPKDETGKYIYYEVVSRTANEDSLKVRAIDFLTKNKKEIKLKSSKETAKVTANGKMVITKSLAMLSRPAGEITYTFNFEVNAQKYRFWLSDFEFIPYQKDRYGNFVPSTTVGVPLENNPGKLNAGEWKEYKNQTFKFAKEFAADFKNEMANATPAVTVKPVEKRVVKKEW